MKTSVRVIVPTVIEDPCLGTGVAGPDMVVLAELMENGKVKIEFRYPEGHPRLIPKGVFVVEILQGRSPDLLGMTVRLAFSVGQYDLTTLLRKVGKRFGLLQVWDLLGPSRVSFPPPHRASSQPPALVN